MLRKDGNVESYTEASSPTPPGQEDVTPTDLISDAVEQVVDNIQRLFSNNEKAPKNDD